MRDGIFRLMRKGLYRHPRCGKVRRSYGYIKNVVRQLEATVYSDSAAVVEEMFYLGDDAIDLREWVDKFSEAITGRSASGFP
jgi:hypothetical protein